MIVLSFYPWCTCTAHWTPNSGDMSVLQYDEVKMQKRSESCSSSTSAVTGEMALHWVNGTDLCDLYFRILIRCFLVPMAVWIMVPFLKILVGVLNPNQRNCLCVKTLRIFVFQNPNHQLTGVWLWKCIHYAFSERYMLRPRRKMGAQGFDLVLHVFLSFLYLVLIL